MRVSKIKIRNILGIEDLEFSPGAVTTISGANSTGKTSVLEALKSVILGGHDATLLRHGANHGEVVLVLDDGTEIKKSVDEDESKLSVKDAKLGRLGAPKSFVDGLVKAQAFNPLQILDMDHKSRLDLLVSLIPKSEETDQQIQELIEKSSFSDSEKYSFLHMQPMRSLEAIRKRLYDERTGANRMAKDKRSTVEELSKTLPSKDELERDLKAEAESLLTECEILAQSIGKERAKISNERERVNSELSANLEAIKRIEKEKTENASRKILSALDSAKAKSALDDANLKRSRDDAVAKLRDVAEDEIRVIKKLLEEKTAYIRDACASDISVLKDQIHKLEVEELRKLEDEKTEIKSSSQNNEGLCRFAAEQKAEEIERKVQEISAREIQLEKLKSDAAAKSELALQQAGKKQVHDFVKQAKEKAEQYEMESGSLSSAIDRVDAAKASMLSAIPIEGLQIVDGDIQIHSVPFDRLSEAQKVEFAVATASLGVGSLPLIVVDGLERLDKERFEIFKRAIAKDGRQLVATRVTEGCLKIEAQ